MNLQRCVWMLTAILWSAGTTECGAQTDSLLPHGAKAVWDLEKAQHETTATRERISINGLWRWQPTDAGSDRVPRDNWGYFKVPGCWPGITNYMQKDCQRVYAHRSWQKKNLRDVVAAWHQREITIPANWTGRRIALYAEYLNSYAAVYVDGSRVGEIRFPADEVDLTSLCRPGQTYELSLLVVAMPLRGVMQSYSDSNSARQVKGTVARRGLCGDVYLVSSPTEARLGNVQVDTSVRNGKIGFACELLSLAAGTEYTLHAQVARDGRPVRDFASTPFRAADVPQGRMKFDADWQSEKLWDTHTPDHQYELTMSLLDANGDVLDTNLPEPFGFREFWIDGRDFYLNGTRIFLCAVPLDNAQIGAAWATYEGAKESLERLQSFGINAVYTHNYGCEPGSHLSFAEILRAADDVGMLVSLSQPHFSHYEWDGEDADRTNGYARHAEFYVRVAQNHPSVVMYSMSHNATGYSEDMNPDLIDGIHDVRNRWSLRNARRAVRAEKIVTALDPTRIVYHHSSGNLSSMHTSNFYPNWVPIQEMSDWFEHWATEGVKPFFTCEYGAPFMWDWTMYRGWYQGEREFGSAVVPWDFCLAEWNAQFLGDEAFRVSEEEKRNLRWESTQFRAGKLWHRWDYPHQVGSRDFDERYPILATYLKNNWRAFRTWGVSAISPWEHRMFWKTRPDMPRATRVEFSSDSEDLQRPGFSPDYLDERYERMDLAFERDDWVATPAARAMYRNNGPLLAYLAGGPAGFTSKDHNFLPGETVEKQIIVINNSRETFTAECEWSLSLPHAVAGNQHVTVATGKQARIPIRMTLPKSLDPGNYALELTARFAPSETRSDAHVPGSTQSPRADVRSKIGGTQSDAIELHVLRRPSPASPQAKVALFDPAGETGALLNAMAVPCESVQADADLSPYDVLIVGKAALTPEGAAPKLARVRDGLNVIVFEQTSQALEKRLGFRVQEYGLRNVFRRVPDHPCLTGLEARHLRDWRGKATLLSPSLNYEPSEKYAGVPVVRWCGLEVPRLWRCGNRGNVASVLIEKPAIGDFLPIVDGGYSLQYSPLLEYREGKGRVLFCQLDVTGRTEEDPAARQLVRNLLAYASESPGPMTPHRKALYAGDASGKQQLEHAGLSPRSYDGGALSPDQVLIVGRGAGSTLARDAGHVARWLQAGGYLLSLALDADEVNTFLPTPIHTQRKEHIAAFFNPPGLDSLLSGVGPADVHNRDPRELPLVVGGAEVVGNGVLAEAEDVRVVFCQLAPHDVIPSIEEATEPQNLRKTYRRTSFLVTRILANMGVRGQSPLLSRFSTPTSGRSADSVVKNGDLRSHGDGDNMPDHWEFSAEMKEATCVLEAGEPAPNKQCLRMTYPDHDIDGQGSVMLAQHNVPVEEGQWYAISLRAKARAPEDPGLTLAIQDTKTWRSLFDYQRLVPGETWKEFNFLVQAKATTSQTRFQIWYEQVATVWIADIHMAPCAPPTQGRWTRGLYVDQPQVWDDPYRFFRW